MNSETNLTNHSDESKPLAAGFSPFPTSFVDNSLTAESILEKCQLLETSEAPISNETYDGPGDQQHRDQILVFEMATLLYLGRLNETRNLWRRTKMTSWETKIMNNLNITNSSSSSPQTSITSNLLSQLWKIGAEMMNHDSPSAFSLLNDLENHSPSLALSPLSPQLIRDITSSYRFRIATHILSLGYVKIDATFAAKKLGFENNAQGCIDYLCGIGWTVSEGNGRFLVPPEKRPREMKHSGGDASERLGILTDIVGFMEKTRLNA